MTLSSVSESPALLTPVVQHSYEVSQHLATLPTAARQRTLKRMAELLKEQGDALLEANTLDLEASREMAIPPLIQDWLKLTPDRIQGMIRVMERLGELPALALGGGSLQGTPPFSSLAGSLMPLGVVALVYEGIPELGAIAAGMCFKTGNSLLLKGGAEASQSNQKLVEILQGALEEGGIPPGALTLLPSDQGSTLRELVTQDRYVDLVIPYGRPSLVQQVARQATVPVLQTAMGNCYLYWASSGSLDLARWMILESHQGEPDPVNAIEKVLVDSKHSSSVFCTLMKSLQDKGFELRGDSELHGDYPDLKLVDPQKWSQSSLEKTVAFKRVEGVEAAIALINANSSGHGDCLATESYQESYQFARQVRSSSIYINTSPRFFRAPPSGLGVALGMSRQKSCGVSTTGGVVGLECLSTVKRLVQGSGSPP